MKMKWSARSGTTGLCCATKNWSLRTPEQTSLNCVKAFCENVYHFFRNLDSVLETHPFGPSSIWNMDEIGFSTVPSRMGKIISLKEVKRVDQITSAKRSSLITLAFAVNAAENPSVTLLSISEKKNEPTLFNICIERNSQLCKRGSGWMQQSEFVKYMHHFIKYSHSSKSSPTLLLLDNHISHLEVNGSNRFGSDHALVSAALQPSVAAAQCFGVRACERVLQQTTQCMDQRKCW